ncbi:MAG: phosphate ABC transporter permease PstA [Neisseria sp.]|nr:phosphate ABC transporter permease PstA [Neisseria sp.]
MDAAVYRRRRMMNMFSLALSWFATGLGLLFLGLILYTLFVKGFGGLSMAVFTQDMPPPMMEGGIRNAIVGSLLVTFFGLLIGTPIGILCGVYLAEFGGNSKFASATRFMNDILLSAPSIIIGVFIWELVVFRQGHFSGWAGSLALALLVIPVVVRTTENMLKLIPNSLREAAYALGAPKWKLVMMVTLRAAKAGVITGVILAFARISGETAPLLFTAFSNNFFTTDMNQPIGNLPKMILDFAMSPYSNWHELAWAGALLITLTVLFANILARYVGSSSKAQH